MTLKEMPRMRFQVTVRNVKTARIIERLIFNDIEEAEDSIRKWETVYGESLGSGKFEMDKDLVP